MEAASLVTTHTKANSLGFRFYGTLTLSDCSSWGYGEQQPPSQDLVWELGSRSCHPLALGTIQLRPVSNSPAFGEQHFHEARRQQSARKV